MSNSIDTNTLLMQLRAMAQDAGIPPAGNAAPIVDPANSRVEFSKILESSLEQINNRNIEAKELREAFEAGTPDVELADVMIAAQKARISFEALTQVRNRVVDAYKEVMSMPL
ncbi:MAG: flagellar hook-basal body complex protein FliE [Granulosicoccus sp.]|nr:flagellar hook-basal body complex protein FliE [Granulosicoccus sp.]